jgi:IS30 family transposase
VPGVGLGFKASTQHLFEAWTISHLTKEVFVPRPWRRITPEKRREIYKLAAQGLSQREIARKVDVTGIAPVLKPFGGVTRAEMWEVSESRLSAEERIDIMLGLERNLSFREIAHSIARDPSTVCREVNNNGGRSKYHAIRAQRQAAQRARRPKLTKLAANPTLCSRVEAELQEKWSPEQISLRLRHEFGDDPSMQISHETIYKSLFVQGRGELRRELARCLRSGRARRVPHGRIEKRGHLKDMVMISERPAEVDDRAVPGHWEGDLLLGKGGKSAIGTLVERSSRFVVLFSLPEGRNAEQVRTSMTKAVKKLPVMLRRSLTWDRGNEMAQHVQFRIDTGIQVYFCDPSSPWQRGSNENTNGLLRQYLPRSRDMKTCTEAELTKIAASLNRRPRKTLNWNNPSEKLVEFVATTD